MLINIKNGAVQLGAELILENINFEVRNTEKIAVVGRNGCGKTTLLRLIAGEIELHSRSSDENVFITRASHAQIGYLKQLTFDDYSVTLDTEIDKVFRPILEMQERIDYLLQKINTGANERDIKEYSSLRERFEDAGGYYYRKEYEVMLKKFGFSDSDKQKKLSEFSGGQLTKIAFIKMLLSKPDVLLLDEPTNHLDITAIEWLEDYLKNYKKAVVIVSHDRMFLDKIVDVVYEIEHKRTKRYVGDYTTFMTLKKQDYEKQKKDYELYRKEVERLEAVVDRFRYKATKAAMAQSKLKQIEHMEKVENPENFDERTFRKDFKPKRDTGKQVLSVTDLKIGYDSVLSTVNLLMLKKQRVGIIGGNGLGKSTFLKTLVGQIDSLGGEFSFGHQVDVGYFDQQSALHCGSKTVLDDFWDEYPRLDLTQARSALGSFLFSGDDVFKTIDMLSGGEKIRLALCKLFESGPNFLILDEPTNHLDIIGKETLEDILKSFDGSVLFVSHDRYFIKQIADSLLVFEKDCVKYLPYGYDEYLEKRTDDTKALDVMPTVSKQETKSKLSYQQSKEITRLTNKLKKTEQKIKDVELEIEKLNESLNSPDNASDYEKLSLISNQIEEKELIALELMEECENISFSLEELSV